MSLFTITLFLLCLLFAASVGYVLWTKGFWMGLTGACSTLLAGAFALRWNVQLSNLSEAIRDYTAVSFLIILVVGSLVFSILSNQGPKLKFYFDKKADKLINIAVVAVFLIIGVVLIQVVSRYPVPDTSPSIEVVGDQVNQGENQGFQAQVQDLNKKLGGKLGSGELYGINKAAQRWFSIPLQISLVLIIYLWGAVGAWAAQDAPQRKSVSNPLLWKILFALIYPISLFVSILLPVYIIDALIPLVLFIPLALIYVKIRNTGLPYEEKVLTSAHIASLLKNMAGSKKKKGHKAAPAMTIIDLSAYGKSFPKDVLKERTETVRGTPGYDLFGKIVNNALLRRATMVEFDFNGEQSILKYFIDGLWHQIGDITKRPFTIPESKNLLTSMRVILGDTSLLQLAALKENSNSKNEIPAVRIPPKVVGQFFIEYDKRGGKKKKMLARLAVQQKGSGESAMIQFERIAIRFGSYEKMRVGQKRAEQIKELLGKQQGLIVFAAAPGQGLRTFTDVSLSETDRFTRDAATVEDVKHPYMPIENLPITTYDSSKGESPATVLPGVFFKEPKLLLLRDLVNKETFQLCCEEIQNERMIITTLRAKTSAEAIMMLLKTGIDPKLLADSLTAVITQKLIRTLCPSCKEEIPASDEICRKLGIRPGQIKTLCRRRVHTAPEPGKRDLYTPCKDCMEIGYRGLAGLYDVIVVNDEIRQIMTTKPSAEAFHRAALKAGGGTFMTDGIRMISEGMTSVEELSRILKQ